MGNINVLADESTHIGHESMLAVFLKACVGSEVAPVALLLLHVDKIFRFGEASQIISFSLALFASLQLNWATTTGRLLGPPPVCHIKTEALR